MSIQPMLPSSPLRRRNALAAGVAAILGLASPALLANSVFVSNCNDSGVGSLRSAVAAAVNGDIVDMTGLTSSSPGCSSSTITLKTGDIQVSQDTLTIKGPGRNALTVTGKYKGTTEPFRLFTHTGTGTLELEYFTMTKGYAATSGDALGGCVSSTGSVFMIGTNAYGCTANSRGSSAKGGAIYARNTAFIKYGNVEFSQAAGSTGSTGGAVYAAGSLTVKYGTISENSAKAASGSIANGFGGGAYSRGSTYIKNSTIANNSVDTVVGGLVTIGGAGSKATILDSTISGNSATGQVGGAYLRASTIAIYNSTIAFNTAGSGGLFAPGLALAVAGSGTLHSNLIANNTYGTPAINDDFSTTGATITGAKNLIRVSSASLPSDTITGSCPILGSLRNNGGPTETLALQSKSPGIDAGDNAYVNGSITGLNQDQRGGSADSSPYPYPRVSGPAPDVGAYEIQQNNIIFTSNLEGCT